MGSLSVDPDALHAIAGKLNAAGGQVASLGPNQCVDTGSPVLTAALDEFGKGW